MTPTMNSDPFMKNYPRVNEANKSANEQVMKKQ
jgi:hypothetical protein